MSLFKSRFAKLEAFAATKPEDRTPDMLKAVQAELDAQGVKGILVPHSAGIESPEQMDKHIEGLKTEASTAKAAAKAAQDAMTALKGERVVDTTRATADGGKGGDDKGQESEEAKAVKTVTDTNRPWNAMAERMGFGTETPKA